MGTMSEQISQAPIVRERRSARVLPVRADGRVLMLHGWAPEAPERPYWFTVGFRVAA